MASKEDFDSLDEELRELLVNYKSRRTTVYEPCTSNNFIECLIGLREELGLFNINYMFNPHLDVEDGTLTIDALVNLINAIWSLLYHHKSLTDKAEKLTDENVALKTIKGKLNGMINQLNEKVNVERHEARACVATAQRISDRSDEVANTLSEANAKLTLLKKQKQANEKNVKTELARLYLENEKLKDRLRSKSGTFTPCSEVCDDSILRLKEREKKQKAVIAQLQANKQELIREVIALKEEILIGSLSDVHMVKRE